MTNKEAIERLEYIKTHHTDPEDYELFDLAIKALKDSVVNENLTTERPQGEGLISREALKKHKVYSEERHEYVVPVYNIDNAPTVELDESVIQEVLNKRCMTAVSNEYLIALHGNNGRSQGKWIPQTDFDGFTYWKCSECNKKNDFEKFNFCPNCGADMRKRSDE